MLPIIPRAVDENAPGYAPGAGAWPVRSRRSSSQPLSVTVLMAVATNMLIGSPATRGSRWGGSSTPLPLTRAAGKKEPQ